MRATARIAGVARNTIDKLLVELGAACSEFQDTTLRNLSCRRLQVDEIWAFCYCKQKNVAEGMAEGLAMRGPGRQSMQIPSWFRLGPLASAIR
jgi:hypothetical protein